jgi:hypothetical protein
MEFSIRKINSEKSGMVMWSVEGFSVFSSHIKAYSGFIVVVSEVVPDTSDEFLKVFIFER